MIMAVWPKEGDELRVLERDVAWYCVHCNQVAEMSPVLGISPASPDVLDAEHHAYHRRIERFRFLVPALYQLANVTGSTLARALAHLDDSCDTVHPDVLEALCCRAAFDGAMCALSILADEQLIDVPVLWSPA